MNPDYRLMYQHLFRALTVAIEETDALKQNLVEAQQLTEQWYLDADEGE